MAILLIFLGLGVLCYLVWKRRLTTLTRNCRWRLDRDAGVWTCAYCEQSVEIGPTETEPTMCMDPAWDGFDKL